MNVQWPRSQGDYGDVSDRLKIRERLQCKSFKWFLDNIFPEQFVPGESPFYGEVSDAGLRCPAKREKCRHFLQIRNRGKTGICLDSQNVEDVDKPLIAYQCHGQAGNQFFLMTKRKEIRREEKCLDYAGGGSELHQAKKIHSIACHSMQGNQMWFYQVGWRILDSLALLHSFRMIWFDMHPATVWNYQQPMIRMCTWPIVIQRIRIKNGFGKNVCWIPPQHIWDLIWEFLVELDFVFILVLFLSFLYRCVNTHADLLFENE